MAYFDKNKIGEIRPNQLITTFGPGAIVDAVKDSVTVLDTNYASGLFGCFVFLYATNIKERRSACSFFP